jgi:hypothetical protein
LYHRHFAQCKGSALGNDACTLAILSAGYGLIPEYRLIAPYDITFQGLPKSLVKERGEKLGIPNAVRKLVSEFPLVFFLLGDDYLRSACPPIVPSDLQRFVFFGSPKLRLPGRAATVIPSGKEEAAKFGEGIVALKGRMFCLLAAGLTQEPTLIEGLYGDNTPETSPSADEHREACSMTRKRSPECFLCRSSITDRQA